MQNKGAGICCLRHGGMTVAGGSQDHVILVQQAVFGAAAVGLHTVEQDAQFVVVYVPVVAVIHDVMRKTADVDVLARKVEFVVRGIHFYTSNPNIFPMAKIQKSVCLKPIDFSIIQKTCRVKSNLWMNEGSLKELFSKVHKHGS